MDVKSKTNPRIPRTYTHAHTYTYSYLSSHISTQTCTNTLAHTHAPSHPPHSLLLSQHFDKLYLMWHEEQQGLPTSPTPCCPAYTMDIVLRLTWWRVLYIQGEGQEERKNRLVPQMRKHSNCFTSHTPLYCQDR